MTSTDWTELRRRLEVAAGALNSTVASPERAREVLDERARVLARPLARPTTGPELAAITFSLANETYAIESRVVWEVFRLRELSPLPGATPPVCGVIAWRGELLTVLDPRSLLGLPVTALNDLSRVLVLGKERWNCGMLVDAVLDIVTIAESEMHPLAPSAAAPRHYLRGITGDAVLVLDADKLLGTTLQPGERAS